ncbi:MAG: hypothetical protein EZS28_048249 [Streblomastix strix]|uniref:Uncharacterized protein n=1 Tax=Streblomastix strix TaxID=222440 RepID=A0A5J4TCV2_9EUKA|nr:MAG: hypothetical protein EZS28_048249 [Streblomastix strix]
MLAEQTLSLAGKKFVFEKGKWRQTSQQNTEEQSNLNKLHERIEELESIKKQMELKLDIALDTIAVRTLEIDTLKQRLDELNSMEDPAESVQNINEDIFISQTNKT